MNRYERHLSAAATIAGFVVDQIFFGPIDSLRTQLLFIGYIAACVLSIAFLHIIERRADEGKGRPRWRPLLPFITQFVLGGFWSGFVFFYGRTAAFGVSWPFLILLVVILVGNEVLKKYHDRLVFTNVLFFFAVYTYAIFAVPIAIGNIGTGTFLLSGAIALGGFALFQALLYLLGRARYKASMRGILVGTALVYGVLTYFYFAGILPPLPLSLKEAGIYHSVVHTPPTYTAIAEQEPLLVRLGLEAPTMHVVAGESLYAFSGVFTPITLSTAITHQWEWYDPVAKQWVTKTRVTYPISGGRLAGYLGYSARAAMTPGKWRVDIETLDGRVIGRINFTVVEVQLPPTEFTKVLD